MRKMTKIATGLFAGVAAVSLAACGGGEDATTDEDTTVTDVDPGEGDGTIDDTTVIDGTIGAEEEMGMEDGMPEDGEAPAGDGEDAAEEEAETEE